MSATLDHIGERIRSARLRAGLTQEELAGTNITRNMLSRIENGAALPSLPTLCALADRLNLPAGALLGELSAYDTHQLTTELRVLLIKKRYKLILERFEASGVSVTDELAFILYSANVERAWELYYEGRLSEAQKCLASSEIYSGLTDADVSNVDIRAAICRMLIENYANLTESDRQKDDTKLKELIFNNNELAIYLYARNMLVGISGRAYSVPDENAMLFLQKLGPLISGLPDGFPKTHIQAKLDMAKADYLAAKAKLVTCIDAQSKLPPSILYDFYTDLELCCKCCGDFENAYKYASLKLVLIQKIK